MKNKTIQNLIDILIYDFFLNIAIITLRILLFIIPAMAFVSFLYILYFLYELKTSGVPYHLYCHCL